jgi:hypothetical protein
MRGPRPAEAGRTAPGARRIPMDPRRPAVQWAVPAPPTEPLALPALGLLDQVQHLRELDALEAAGPGRFAAALQGDLGAGDETLGTLGAQLDALRQALASVDQFARKAMGIRLTHLLATAPVTPQFRTLVASTVTSYAGDTALLRRRLGGSLSEGLLDEVVAAAERVLGLGQALRRAILELGRQVATAQAPWVQKAGRDRSLPDLERNRLRKARVDLEGLGERPERIGDAPFEERLKAHPLPEEEPVVEATEDRRFSLLEID